MYFLVKLFAQNRKVAFCMTGTAVALLGIALGYRYTRRQRKLTRVGVVSQLLLHPMKSGKAVCVPAAECLRMGLKCGDLRDRWGLQQQFAGYHGKILCMCDCQCQRYLFAKDIHSDSRLKNKQINQIRFPKIMKYFLKVLIYDRDRVSNKIRKKYFLYQISFCFSAISATHQQIFAKALYSLRVTFIFC